jgi:hypothetical protein
MKPDKILIKHLLKILNRIGPSGIEEAALSEELGVAACKPITTSQADDTRIFCVDRGWAGSRKDEFEQVRCWITEAGKTTLAGM